MRFLQKIGSKPFIVYAVMILLGILAGEFNIPVLKELGLILADIFIRLFKCISLPIIAFSIIVTLANYNMEGTMRHVWKRAMTYTLSTTLIAATISCLMYLLIQPESVSEVNAASMLNTQQFNYFTHLSTIIPATFITPFLEQQVIGVLIISLVIGIAIRFIPDEDAKQTVKSFFRGIHGLLMVITRWIIALIPLGIFGFVTTTVVQFNQGANIHGIGSYLLVVVLANLVQGFIVLPLWLKSQGIAPFKAMKGMMPALSVAFFSKSSVGTLPITMDVAEKNLQVQPRISRFVLPLCTSLNMNGCAAFIFATVIYLMQNHGMPISLPIMGLWIMIATIAAIGNAGVPMGCFFLSASLLASMNVPITLMGIILPFYTLIDMVETALNVWSDACVTKVVDDKLKKVGIEDEPAAVEY